MACMIEWMKEVDKCAWERWEKTTLLLTHTRHVRNWPKIINVRRVIYEWGRESERKREVKIYTYPHGRPTYSI